MNKLAASILPVLLLIAATSSGQPAVKPYVNSEVLDALLAGKELRHSVGTGMLPQLIPEVAMKEEILNSVTALQPNIGVEVLRLHAGGEQYLDTPQVVRGLYNILRSVSSMQGIQYYSASRKRMRTLFAQSYVVDGLETQKRLPDPLVEEIPEYSAILLFQEDLTFGKNIYFSEYIFADSYLAIRTRNLTTMRYLLTPIVRPEHSLNWMIIIPSGKSVLFYGLSCARTAGLLGLERVKEDSFYNRLNAIYGWFTEKVKERF